VTGSVRQPVAIIGKAIALGDLFVGCLNRLIAAKRQIKKCNKNHFFL